MNKIKSQFSIYDIELLSGIKAHTIRIWEKRYNLFTPERNDLGARLYNIQDLRKILNITFLLDNGFKISKIALLQNADINTKVIELQNETNFYKHYFNQLKLATIEFNAPKFEEIYYQLLKFKSFLEIVQDVFLPFLKNIGLQWQTNTLNEANEHFISNLIRQKILIQIDKTPFVENANATKYVLFLPNNDMHDISLLFIHYQLKIKGHPVIYIGSNLLVQHLLHIAQTVNNIAFVTYFTVSALQENVEYFLNELTDTVLQPFNAKLYLSIKNYNPKNNLYISVVNSVEEMLENKTCFV